MHELLSVPGHSVVPKEVHQQLNLHRYFRQYLKAVARPSWAAFFDQTDVEDGCICSVCLPTGSNPPVGHKKKTSCRGPIKVLCSFPCFLVGPYRALLLTTVLLHVLLLTKQTGGNKTGRSPAGPLQWLASSSSALKLSSVSCC